MPPGPSGSVFHRIIPGFMCQGGVRTSVANLQVTCAHTVQVQFTEDFTNGNGTGGEPATSGQPRQTSGPARSRCRSIYGEKFEDEWTNGYVTPAACILLWTLNFKYSKQSPAFLCISCMLFDLTIPTQRHQRYPKLQTAEAQQGWAAFHGECREGPFTDDSHPAASSSLKGHQRLPILYHPCSMPHPQSSANEVGKASQTHPDRC